MAKPNIIESVKNFTDVGDILNRNTTYNDEIDILSIDIKQQIGNEWSSIKTLNAEELAEPKNLFNGNSDFIKLQQPNSTNPNSKKPNLINWSKDLKINTYYTLQGENTIRTSEQIWSSEDLNGGTGS